MCFVQFHVFALFSSYFFSKALVIYSKSILSARLVLVKRSLVRKCYYLQHFRYLFSRCRFRLCDYYFILLCELCASLAPPLRWRTTRHGSRCCVFLSKFICFGNTSSNISFFLAFVSLSIELMRTAIIWSYPNNEFGFRSFFTFPCGLLSKQEPLSLIIWVKQVYHLEHCMSWCQHCLSTQCIDSDIVSHSHIVCM